MRRLAWVGLLVMVASCARASSFHKGFSPYPHVPAQRPAGFYHQVERGETLFRIARTYGTTAEALKEKNRLSDPSKIEVGQWLYIPRTQAAKNPQQDSSRIP